MEHFFSYVTGSLTDVSFNVYAAEDIRAADGVSENYYTKDQLVGTITTDGTGIAELRQSASWQILYCRKRNLLWICIRRRAKIRGSYLS